MRRKSLEDEYWIPWLMLADLVSEWANPYPLRLQRPYEAYRTQFDLQLTDSDGYEARLVLAYHLL